MLTLNEVDPSQEHVFKFIKTGAKKIILYNYLTRIHTLDHIICSMEGSVLG
jgi:hypothetical protein